MITLKDSRLVKLQQWLVSELKRPVDLQPMVPGAGVRRYYRVNNHSEPLIVMDSPVDEKFMAFIELAAILQKSEVTVPMIYATELNQGFLLLSDFGDQIYGNILTHENVDSLYHQAFGSLIKIQLCAQNCDFRFQSFDWVHYREKMQWFCEFFLKVTPQQLNEIFDFLVESVQQQPIVCVHYDYHSRNLIHLPTGQTGVIDFQDTVLGPVTYDLMSLLRDCYVDWPIEKIRIWQEQYRQLALAANIINQDDSQLWIKWCDFISAVRHIKCIGLFARFDQLGINSHYLQYIPRSMNYLRQISNEYPELAALKEVLENIK